MHMENSFFEQIPFPYFIIDDEYRIVFSSKSANVKFPPTASFIDIVHSSQWTTFLTFIRNIDETAFLDIKLAAMGDVIELYQVYKLTSNDGNIHLFCIPKEAASPEIHDILDSVEQKISNLNIELEANKYSFDQQVSEIKEAAILSDHLATIGQLAAGIAHEIRNPLTTVKGFIQLIQPHLAVIGKEEYAIIALDEINRANDIIYEFLNAAKPQQNKKQFTNINKLVHDIMMLYESEAILRGIDFETRLVHDNLSLYIDIKQVKQVLVNIVKNAIEAIEDNPYAEKGQIRITTEMNNGFAVIFIEDNGVGMEQKTIDKLFMPFFSTKEAGTGIGLTVCKKIIEDHGGTIQVSSTPYQGTAFQIALPIFQNKI